MDELLNNHEEVSGEIELEKKINDYDMEISEDGGEDTEEDANIESSVYSENQGA